MSQIGNLFVVFSDCVYCTGNHLLLHWKKKKSSVKRRQGKQLKLKKNDAISLIEHNSEVSCIVQEIINKSFLLLGGKTTLQFFISLS